MKLLIVNPGSTSLKFKLYDFPGEKILAQGRIERIGSSSSPWYFVSPRGEEQGEIKAREYPAALNHVVAWLKAGDGQDDEQLSKLSAVGFKAVHAGRLGAGPGATYLSEEVVAAMERFLPVAPFHNRIYLDCIRAFEKILPDVPRAALFESAFHVTISEEKTTLGVPVEWQERHEVRRYGFHGASHHYIARRLPELLGFDEKQASTHRAVSCHLGGSSSFCALRGDVSVDTTMGFSPQSGLLHSTRCETLDAFVALYLQKAAGFAPDDLIRVLCEESGLKGLSGLSGDVRDLADAARRGDKRAQLALDVFYYQARRELGAMIATLGGIETLVFTGGIGENDPETRTDICQNFGFVGVELDPRLNEQARGTEMRISPEGARVAVWVIPTNEEVVVAREIFNLLSSNG